MKKNIFILLLNFFLVALPECTYAFATVEQQVLLDFPVINTVESESQNTSSDINNENGALSNNMETFFNVSTNNESGVIAEFQALADTKSGMIEAMSGINPNNNTGKIVLTNSDSLPDQASVSNALGASPFSENNPNSITYEISFTNKTIQMADPVFASTGDNIARGNVIKAPGSARVDVIVKNSSYNRDTFSSNYDKAGIYQATIYCTVYSP